MGPFDLSRGGGEREICSRLWKGRVTGIGEAAVDILLGIAGVLHKPVELS